MASEKAEEDAVRTRLTMAELAEAAQADGVLADAGLLSDSVDGPEGAESSKVRRILDAAASVFARRGFNEARMDDVAQEAGVSKGGLYLHFPSKDALFEGLVGYLVGMETRRLHAAKDAAGPVADRLAGFFHGYAMDLLAWARFYPLIMEVYSRSFRHASVRRVMQTYIDMYVRELAELIREGIDSGEFRDVDPEQVALQLISLLEGLALVWGVDPERIRIPETADRGVRLVLDGLLVRPAPVADSNGGES
jgi:AcrR family transcriptional regulator